MDKFIPLEQMDEAANYIRQHSKYQPKIAMILGSGLGDLAESVVDPDIIPFNDLPNWPVSTVQGHKGRLVIGKLDNHEVLVMQGRVHSYEGYPIQEVAFPIRVLQRLGIEVLIVTNAAGAVNPNYLPGDVMLITDHITLMPMAGLNPLRGPNIEELGERFPDMSQSYDRALNDLARQAAKQAGVDMREGVYICLSGPSFETPADLRFLQIIGSDAVGMSTVPEVIVARHGKIRVLGLSGISNKANLDGSTVTTHEEVLEAGKLIVPKLKAIILGVLKHL